MKIYTKTGDRGQTSLVGGSRIDKGALRIDAYGTVDELNSYLGLIGAFEEATEFKELIEKIQNDLFVLGANLASDPDRAKKVAVPFLEDDDVLFLEKQIDLIADQLPALKHFVLPGGTKAASFGHVARCVCRRAERLIVKLAAASSVPDIAIVYMNRLSDLLFVLSRKLCVSAGVEEIKWIPKVNK